MPTSYGEAAALPEPSRAAPGHAGSPDPPDSSVGPATRLRDRAGDPGRLERRAAGRSRIALPRASPPREAEMDCGDVEDLREQAAHPRLSIDCGRTPAARVRAVPLADAGRGDERHPGAPGGERILSDRESLV